MIWQSLLPAGPTALTLQMALNALSKHIVCSCKHHSDRSTARGTCMASPWWCVALSDVAPGSHLCALLGWTGLGVMFLPVRVCISPLSLTKGRQETLFFALNFLSFFLSPDYVWTQRESLVSERSQTWGHNCHNVEMRQLQEMGCRVSSSCWTSYMTLSPAFCIYCW